MNSSNMGIVSQFIGSIAKFDAYKELKDLSLGKAFTYLFVLTLVFGTISLIKPAIELNKEIKEMSEVFKQEFPDFKLDKGEFKFEGAMPFLKTDTGGKSVIIIDTTGRTQSNALDKYKQGIFITKSKLYYKKNEIEKREYDFNNFKDFTITKSDVEGLLGFSFVIVVLFAVFYLIGFMLGKMFSALILGVVGLILASVMKVTIDYAGLYKLSIYSLTAPIILDVGLDIFSIDLPMGIYLLIATAILGLGLNKCKTGETPVV